MEAKITSRVLVIGAGIAGINAALRLAEARVGVYLCENKPYIGGTLSQLDKWFPDNHCGLCQSLPTFDRDNFSQYCLRQGLFHSNINILLNSSITKVEGEAGNFSVLINTRSTGVKKELCTGCGLCELACPIESADEFNLGLGKQKAIHLGNPLSISRIFMIDKKNCTRCGLCVEKCPARAIDLDLPDEESEIKVDSIILATGFEEFDPLPATACGYRRYPNVITNIEMERILSGSGPSGGSLTRPSDGKIPRSIAFIQCVGSRTRKRDYCSATCCMQSLKEAILIREALPKAEIDIHYMDLRDYGKGYYVYRQQAQEKYGLKFIHGRIPAVQQDFRTKDLLLTVMGEDQKINSRRYDLVVLAVGQSPSMEFTGLCRKLGVDVNRWGFCSTEVNDTVKASRQGIYVCGSAAGPKDIVDSVVEGLAAAGEALYSQRREIKDDGSPHQGEKIIPRALIVGGGLAGITVALDIAEKGFEVEVLEKSSHPGGNGRQVYSALNGPSPSQYIDELLKKIESQALIYLRRETSLVGLSGYAGNFKYSVEDGEGKTQDMEAGVIILATGGSEFHPDEYLYGKSPEVITQQVLEEKIYRSAIDPRVLKSVVMIQCVGSRCHERPYCSRVCCIQALKNALALKILDPAMEITIFYRDLMTYGFQEEYYTQAREKGIRFIRFDPDHKPAVDIDGDEIRVTAIDPVLNEKLEMKPDLVVLSTAVVPTDNTDLAKLLGVELTPEGFFKEAEPKFRPLDTLRDGIFVCGLAHSPGNFAETITQAHGAAWRAASFLLQDYLKSSRVISQVDERRCAGCERCIKTCPYQARIKDSEKGVARVIEHLCRGCGVCATVCPDGAAQLRDFEAKHMLEILEEAF
jgi:heterodisulfide reductase subunit A-like polyferredoxin